MALIWFFVNVLCGSVFLAIGLYAKTLETPMWFWAGSTVDASTISDVTAYNRETGNMWIQYSIPYWISGVIYAWLPEFATALLVGACSIGIGWLVWRYYRIIRRYKK